MIKYKEVTVSYSNQNPKGVNHIARKNLSRIQISRSSRIKWLFNYNHFWTRQDFLWSCPGKPSEMVYVVHTSATPICPKLLLFKTWHLEMKRQRSRLPVPFKVGVTHREPLFPFPSCGELKQHKAEAFFCFWRGCLGLSLSNNSSNPRSCILQSKRVS